MGDIFLFFWIICGLSGIFIWVYGLFKDHTRYFYFELKSPGYTPEPFKRMYKFVICIKNAPKNFFSAYECSSFHEEQPMMWQIKVGITQVDQKPNINNDIYLALKKQIGNDPSKRNYDISGEEIDNKKAKILLREGISPIYYT